MKKVLGFLVAAAVAMTAGSAMAKPKGLGSSKKTAGIGLSKQAKGTVKNGPKIKKAIRQQSKGMTRANVATKRIVQKRKAGKMVPPGARVKALAGVAQIKSGVAKQKKLVKKGARKAKPMKPRAGKLSDSQMLKEVGF